MPYELDIRPRAKRDLRELRRIDPRTAARVADLIRRLGENPRDRELNVKALQGREGFRAREGVYRILFTIDDANKVVTIGRVANRRDAYR